MKPSSPSALCDWSVDPAQAYFYGWPREDKMCFDFWLVTFMLQNEMSREFGSFIQLTHIIIPDFAFIEEECAITTSVEGSTPLDPSLMG